MAFVYERRGVRYWWICWTDADGIERRCSSKTTNREKAIALANELERQERAKVERRTLGGLTVRKFFEETWLPLRRRQRPFAWKSDNFRLGTHFLPVFGPRCIAE